MSVQYYRKKTTLGVEAIRWSGSNFEELVEWCPAVTLDRNGITLWLQLDEIGHRTAVHFGDWVVRGDIGCFACGPDYFTNTYERVLL